MTKPKNMTEEEITTWVGIFAAQRLAHKTATDAGWYTDPKTGEQINRNFGEVVALMHSELSTAALVDDEFIYPDDDITFTVETGEYSTDHQANKVGKEKWMEIYREIPEQVYYEVVSFKRIKE